MNQLASRSNNVTIDFTLGLKKDKQGQNKTLLYEGKKEKRKVGFLEYHSRELGSRNVYSLSARRAQVYRQELVCPNCRESWPQGF